MKAPFFSLALLTFCVRTTAGFDAGSLIERSPELEKAVSHVVVGRFKDLHEMASGSHRFAAEIEVSSVEKGDGVAPGSRIFVHFQSARNKHQMLTERLGSSCGNYKIDPIPGEFLRLYMKLNEDYDFVADYPDCFFYTRPKKPEKAVLWPIIVQGSTSFALIATGIAIGWGWRSRRPHRIVSEMPASLVYNA